MSTGVGSALVAAGAILGFAVPATFIHGLNVHVIGVFVMLAGVFGLLLSLLVWGPLSRRRNHSGGLRPQPRHWSAAEPLPGPATSTRPVAAVIGRMHCGGASATGGYPPVNLPRTVGRAQKGNDRDD
jgi:hypothetical protein